MQETDWNIDQITQPRHKLNAELFRRALEMFATIDGEKIQSFLERAYQLGFIIAYPPKFWIVGSSPGLAELVDRLNGIADTMDIESAEGTKLFLRIPYGNLLKSDAVLRQDWELIATKNERKREVTAVLFANRDDLQERIDQIPGREETLTEARLGHHRRKSLLSPRTLRVIRTLVLATIASDEIISILDTLGGEMSVVTEADPEFEEHVLSVNYFFPAS